MYHGNVYTITATLKRQKQSVLSCEGSGSGYKGFKKKAMVEVWKEGKFTFCLLLIKMLLSVNIFSDCDCIESLNVTKC